MSARLVSCVAGLALLSALGCGEDTTSTSAPKYSELSDNTFTVGDSGVVVIGNFAGTVRVLPGSAGHMDVTVTKWAEREADLAQLQVNMLEIQDGIWITTDNPAHLDRVSTDVVVTVPEDARPTIENGAGDVYYDGGAVGPCSFTIGAGNLTVKLRPDPNVEVHLGVGAGTINVGFVVSGNMTAHRVDGIIGTGADGAIIGNVGAGTIGVGRR